MIGSPTPDQVIDIRLVVASVWRMSQGTLACYLDVADDYFWNPLVGSATTMVRVKDFASASACLMNQSIWLDNLFKTPLFGGDGNAIAEFYPNFLRGVRRLAKRYSREEKWFSLGRMLMHWISGVANVLDTQADGRLVRINRDLVEQFQMCEERINTPMAKRVRQFAMYSLLHVEQSLRARLFLR